MNLKTKIITDNIVLVSTYDNTPLSYYFLRFQEYYESPEFKDKIFTLGQLREWYSIKYGAFTYYSDFVGFNIPSSVIDKFKTGIFDPLTEEENELLELFKYRTDKYYIIGAQDSSLDVIQHEICHGLYYKIPEYKKKVDVLINKAIKAKDQLVLIFMEHLGEIGYHEDVFVDEINAYYATEPEATYHGVSFNKNLRNKLKALFKERLDEIQSE